MSGHTLEEALSLGRGVERPFRCISPDHEDSNASASVNVVKMLWHCYSCKASGMVDKNRAPTPDELLAMLEPEQACREMAAGALAMYGWGGYWQTRFPDWVCWLQGLGEDPWSADAVFPVHTPRGRLAGVGRRMLISDGPRYKFPYNWSASRTLFGSRGQWAKTPVMVIVEGAADQSSLVEVGLPAWATFSAGLHAPQFDLIASMSPELVVMAYDADDAGQRAAEHAYDRLSTISDVAFVDWGLCEVNDPAQAHPSDRLDLVLQAVGDSPYGAPDVLAEQAALFVRQAKELFVEETRA